MSRSIFRQVIRADDQRHTFTFTGPIVHVATRQEDAVEVWFIEDTDGLPVDRAFRVVGTGHPLPPALAHHIGTAVTPSGRFVWHLMEHERVEPPALTVPCDGKCGNDDPHDAHLAPGALAYLHGGTDG